MCTYKSLYVGRLPQVKFNAYLMYFPVLNTLQPQRRILILSCKMINQIAKNMA